MSDVFENVEVGDEIFIEHGYLNERKEIRTVKRVTKTQVIDSQDSKWRRSDGRMVGSGGYWVSGARPVREGDRKAVEARNARNYLRYFEPRGIDKIDDDKVIQAAREIRAAWEKATS